MAIDPSEASGVGKNGIVITDDDENVIAYITGGNGTPVGQQAPVPTLYVSDGATLFLKFGPGVNDWREIDTGDLFVGGVGANYNFIPIQCIGGGDANGN
jgi:hypothetical protein